jgi:predicted anti-sigma-YlaC factor YlaD
VNSSTECERVRLALMAALDREPDSTGGDVRSDSHEHLASCSSCRRWLKDLESMNSRFQNVSYPAAKVDLWATVEGRVRHRERGLAVTHRLWLIGTLVVVWRAAQLLTDLPVPLLYPIVPLVGAMAAVWLVARDLLTIETFAPELEKRGA